VYDNRLLEGSQSAKLTWKNYSDEYKSEIIGLAQHIFGLVKPKVIVNQQLGHGREWTRIFVLLVENLNEVDKVGDELASSIAIYMGQKLFHNFTNELGRLIPMFPILDTELKTHGDNNRSFVLETFSSQCSLRRRENRNEHEQLGTRTTNHISSLRSDNTLQLIANCQDRSTSIKDEIETYVKGQSATERGYHQLVEIHKKVYEKQCICQQCPPPPEIEDLKVEVIRLRNDLSRFPIYINSIILARLGVLISGSTTVVKDFFYGPPFCYFVQWGWHAVVSCAQLQWPQVESWISYLNWNNFLTVYVFPEAVAIGSKLNPPSILAASHVVNWSSGWFLAFGLFVVCLFTFDRNQKRYYPVDLRFCLTTICCVICLV
jgi:hypothetical protein